MAEQERKKNRQRQAEGIEVARGEGVVFGRPKQEIDGKCGAVPGMESRPDYRDGRYASDRYEIAYILPASEGIRGNQ